MNLNSDASSARTFHQDETRILELHKQTEHKLDVMRMYMGQHPSIIAQAGKRGTIRADRVFIVDACCGGGRHLSREHPLNQIPGTAIQACIEAREVQKRYPATKVCVRLIDLDRDVCNRLSALTDEYRSASGVEHVDVTVECADFASRIESILAESRYAGGRYCILWFFDPFGIEEIPHSAFDPILEAKRGQEIIINFDVAATVRNILAAKSQNTDRKTREGFRRVLDRLFGDRRWEHVLNRSMGWSEQLNAVAAAYKDTFEPFFKFRAAYRLRSSESQERCLVHLTNSKTALERFAKSYETSLRIGTIQGSRMTYSDRGKAVAKLFEAFRGKDVPLDIMLKQMIYPLTKSTYRPIFRQANIEGYGRYDSRAKVMRWFTKRERDTVLPLLDINQHEERVKDPGPQLGLF